MIKDAFIEDNKVIYSNEDGDLKEDKNLPLVEETIKCQNEIDTIKDAIELNSKNIKYYKSANKDLFLYWLLLTFGVSIMIFLELLLWVPFSNTYGLLLTASDIYYALFFLGVEIVGGGVLIGKHFMYNKKIKGLKHLQKILNKKLNKKKNELEEYKVKQITYEFEKNKEKRIIDFEKAKREYQELLFDELNTEMKSYKFIKPKTYTKKYAKHLKKDIAL